MVVVTVGTCVTSDRLRIVNDVAGVNVVAGWEMGLIAVHFLLGIAAVVVIKGVVVTAAELVPVAVVVLAIVLAVVAVVKLLGLLLPVVGAVVRPEVIAAFVEKLFVTRS